MSVGTLGNLLPAAVLLLPVSPPSVEVLKGMERYMTAVRRENGCALILRKIRQAYRRTAAQILKPDVQAAFAGPVRSIHDPLAIR